MSGMTAVMSRMNELQNMMNPVPEPAKVEVAKAEETSTGDDFASVLQRALNPENTTKATTTTDSLNASLTAALSPAKATKTASSAPVEAVKEAPKVQTSPSTSKTGATGDDVVSEAKKYLGIPYVWGGTSTKGFDCSGLVQHVMRDLGVEMPRVARDQAKKGEVVPSLAQAKPGDLLGMRNGTHIAIYLGDNKILHAPQPGSNVSIRSLMRSDDIDTIRRVLPAESNAAPAPSIAGARAALEARSGS